MKYFAWQSMGATAQDGIVISFYNVSNGEIFLKITLTKEIRSVDVLDEFLPIKEELGKVCMDIYSKSKSDIDTMHNTRLFGRALEFDKYIRPLYRDIKLKELGI